MLTLRLTDEEMGRLASEAVKAGQELSEFVRGKLSPLKSMPTPNPPTILDWRSVGIYVVTPNPIDQTHWDQLRRYVCEVLKPTPATQENRDDERS